MALGDAEHCKTLHLVEKAMAVNPEIDDKVATRSDLKQDQQQQYGFKCVKSIVSLEFTDKRPVDNVVMAIVDSWSVGDKVKYKK